MAAKPQSQNANIIAQSNGIIFFSLDSDYRYTSFSPTHKSVMKQIWGADISVGMNMLGILSEPDRSKAKQNFDRALAGDTFTRIEEYGDTERARSFWEDHYEPVRDAAGHINGVMVLVLEVSNRREFASMLRDSSERLNLAIKAASVGIWEWDIVTNDVFWSDEILKIFGVDDRYKRLTVDQYTHLIHIEDREQVKNEIERSIAKLTPYFVQHRIVWPSGKIRHVEGTGKVLLSDGKPVKMIGTVMDVTDRKLLESERQDWQSRYELVTRSSGQIVYDYFLPSGKIIWSENVLKEIGFDQSEIDNVEKWGDLIHPDDRAEAFALLEDAEKSLSEYDITYRFKTKSYGYLYMWDRGFFMANNNGKAYRMLGVMQNVNSEKIAETELKESESRYRTLQEASFGGIALHRLGKIIDANKGLSVMTGYPVEELIGMNGLDLIADEYRSLVIGHIKSGYEIPYDVIGVRKDGSQFSIEVHGKNVPYKGETLSVTEFRNISERKDFERRIVEQNKSLTIIAEDLKKKNEQLEEFTQIVSHNLRSPVSNILSLLDFYEKTIDEHERSKLLSMLRESGTKILTNLHELNEVLKIKQAKDIERQQLSFAEVIQSVSHQLSARIAETQAEIRTSFAVDTVLYPNIYLESILMNLLSNALKYRHPDRAPKILIETYELNGNLFLKITDNGLGLDLKRYGSHVFKLRKTFHVHPESRGIGLFMIKNQIEAMGGEIAIESEENKGTTFTVLLSK
ncbi:MAG: PAS domain-containing protein [Flammeovirgaceae bacterium]